MFMCGSAYATYTPTAENVSRGDPKWWSEIVFLTTSKREEGLCRTLWTASPSQAFTVMCS